MGASGEHVAMTTPLQPCLTLAESKALKIAAHRQLRRWNNQELRGELDRPERRDVLRRAVDWLEQYGPVNGLPGSGSSQGRRTAPRL